MADQLVEKKFADYYTGRIRACYLGTDDERVPWLRQQEYVLKIRDACREKGYDFHVIIFPLLFGLESSYEYYDIEEEITRFVTSNDIPVFSLTPDFIGHESASLWVSPNDQHPNEKGHRIAAGSLYGYMARFLDR